MDLFCRHGDGVVVLTSEGALVYVVDGRICSSDVPLTLDARRSLEGRVRRQPPRAGRLTTRQIQASLRVSYDEDEHPDDCSLGSEDTWSEEEDEDDLL